MGHGVPMARVRGAERLDALRARWHHASLKTSFMVYMLGFLLLALVMSTVTAGMFSGLQHRVIADAYEISGLYLYDAHNRTLVPARAVDIDENSSSVFVQTMRGEMTEMPLTNCRRSWNPLARALPGTRRGRRICRSASDIAQRQNARSARPNRAHARRAARL